MKTFVTIFHFWLQNIHLTKDVWLIPYYMHKLFWYDAKVVTNAEVWEQYQDLEKYTKWLIIERVKKKRIFYLELGLIAYLIKNAKKIDILNVYHFSGPSLLYSCIYKAINPKGKIYVKLDLNIQNFKEKWYRMYNYWYKIQIKQWLVHHRDPNCHLVSLICRSLS